jgi:hypothetical protein
MPALFLSLPTPLIDSALHPLILLDKSYS